MKFNIFYKSFIFFLILVASFTIIEKTFAIDGALIWKQYSNPSSGLDDMYKAAIDSSGIYVVGYEANGIYQNSRIEKRSLLDGSLIWAKVKNNSAYSDSFYSVINDLSGVYTFGSWMPSGYQVNNYLEKRSLNDGATIWEQTIIPSAGNSNLSNLNIDSSGIYMSGYSSIGSGSNWDRQWRIEKRSLSNGNQIWLTNSNPTTGSDAAQATVIDSSNIYVAGSTGPNNLSMKWRVEKRALDNGSLAWGVEESVTTGGPDYIKEDTTGIYLGGYYDPGSKEVVKIQKRAKNNGSIIWNKDISPTPYYGNRMTGLEVNSDGVFIAYYSAGLDPAGYLEKRSLSDGSLVWKKELPMKKYIGYPLLKLEGSSIYVYSPNCVNINSCTDVELHIEKRSQSDGSIIWGSVDNPSQLRDVYKTILPFQENVYLVGYDLNQCGAVSCENYQWLFIKRGNFQATVTVNPNPVSVNQLFSADISASVPTDNITRARFLLNENVGVVPNSTDTRWSPYYDWNISSGNWNATTKILSNQSFATAGNKEVWAEVSNAIGTISQAKADLVVSDICVPNYSYFCTASADDCNASNCGTTLSNLCYKLDINACEGSVPTLVTTTDPDYGNCSCNPIDCVACATPSSRSWIEVAP